MLISVHSTCQRWQGLPSGPLLELWRCQVPAGFVEVCFQLGGGENRTGRCSRIRRHFGTAWGRPQWSGLGLRRVGPSCSRCEHSPAQPRRAEQVERHPVRGLQPQGGEPVPPPPPAPSQKAVRRAAGEGPRFTEHQLQESRPPPALLILTTALWGGFQRLHFPTRSAVSPRVGGNARHQALTCPAPNRVVFAQHRASCFQGTGVTWQPQGPWLTAWRWLQPCI